MEPFSSSVAHDLAISEKRIPEIVSCSKLNPDERVVQASMICMNANFQFCLESLAKICSGLRLKLGQRLFDYWLSCLDTSYLC